jgi:hypothetical protein
LTIPFLRASGTACRLACVSRRIGPPLFDVFEVRIVLRFGVGILDSISGN